VQVRLKPENIGQGMAIMKRFINRKLAAALACVAMAGVVVLPGVAQSKDRETSWPRISTPKTYVQAPRVVSTSLSGGEHSAVFKNNLRLKKQVLAYAPKRKFTHYASHKVTARAVYGQARWVCTPSGFGRRASCSARG
jgi:hypothetical protein